MDGEVLAYLVVESTQLIIVVMDVSLDLLIEGFEVLQLAIALETLGKKGVHIIA